VVATLSSEGDRENLGEPTLSASGLKALRRLDGLRFLLGALEREDMLERLRGTLSCGMCGGGDAIFATSPPLRAERIRVVLNYGCGAQDTDERATRDLRQETVVLSLARFLVPIRARV